MIALSISLALVAIVLLLAVIRWPQVTAGPGGKALAFVAFFLLPALATWFGTSNQVARSKHTEFCLSCHTMEPYGASLLADDSESLVAAHYQNRRIPRDEACFTCHTTYTMFGDVAAKFRGLRHLYVTYLGTTPAKLALYSPYSNRECLHCHEGARSYVENDMHADSLADLRTGKTSCLECHAVVHDVEHVAAKEVWKSVAQ